MKNYQEAAPQSESSRYFAREDGLFRIFGGLNWCMFGDVSQLPPIPSSSAIFVPPQGKPRPPTKTTEEVLEAFWTAGDNSLNFFVELTQQQRTTDLWYHQLLNECRIGALRDENYNFLMGLPTTHHGCWLPPPYEEDMRCKKERCKTIHVAWKDFASQGADWTTMQTLAPECTICKNERARRNRMVTEHAEKVSQAPFLHAPYVHQNNQPKYHAMLVRAVEHAKRGATTPKQVLWVRAQDTPIKTQDIGRTPEQVDRKLVRFLQLHDQRTAGIPGLFVMYMGAPVRTTEKIKLSPEIIVLKHSSGKIVGWELHTADATASSEFEVFLKYLPKVAFVQFPGVTWQLPGLAPGVLPMRTVTRIWVVNKDTNTKVSRKGFTLVNDFASTAFMMQGETLEAMLADCGGVWEVVGLAEMLTCYVILSRIKTADALLLLRAFSKRLFQQGEPAGPKCLMQFLHSRFNKDTGEVVPDGSIVLASEDVQARYVDLNEVFQKTRRQQVTTGLEWTCSTCEQALPAAGYGVEATDLAATMEACILRGSWRRCTACCDGTDPRKWKGQFEIQTCHDCSQSMRRSDLEEVRLEKEERLIYRCKKCVKDKDQVLCTVCKRWRDKDRFLARSSRLQKCIARCTDCRTCESCGAYFADARHFVCNTKRCIACTLHECTVCNIEKTRKEFTTKQRENVQCGYQTKLVCNTCAKAKLYPCAAEPCRMQEQQKREQDFDAAVWKNKVKHGEHAVLICRTCAELGYSTRNGGTVSHRCARCRQSLGHCRFTKTPLSNKKQRPDATLYCKECRGI